VDLQQLGEARGNVIPRRQIPYDYSFVYELADPDDSSRGFVNQLLSKTITVSIEAPFTAVSMSYALFVPDQSIRFGPGDERDLEPLNSPNTSVTSNGSPVLLRSITGSSLQPAGIPFDSRVRAIRPQAAPNAPLPVSPIAPRAVLFGDLVRSLSRRLRETVSSGEIGPKTAQALMNGIRINPQIAKRVLLTGGEEVLEADDLEELFEAVGVQPERVQFLYALHDDGTGRAFQSDPIFNLAGLGSANGERPFRHFATPITFMPRTTIRLEVTPKSDFHGELHVILHGYKVLGAVGTPTGRSARQLKRSG